MSVVFKCDCCHTYPAYPYKFKTDEIHYFIVDLCDRCASYYFKEILSLLSYETGETIRKLVLSKLSIKE